MATLLVLTDRRSKNLLCGLHECHVIQTQKQTNLVISQDISDKIAIAEVLVY